MTKSATPRTTSNIPSVTRNEGILSRVTNRPLNSPIAAEMRSAATKPTNSEVEPCIVERPHHDRREAEHRAHGEIEFASRHEKRHGERDETELDGEGQRVRDVERRQERGIDRREDRNFEDQQHEGAELRRRYDAAEGRGLRQVRSPGERAAKASADGLKVMKSRFASRRAFDAGRGTRSGAYLADIILS